MVEAASGSEAGVSNCQCRCHAYGEGTNVTCDLDAGYGVGCGPHATADGCDRCGSPDGQPHTPVDGDCALPHRYNQRSHPPRARIGHVCTGCVDRHRDWVREITELFATLPEVIAAGSIPDDTAKHKRPKKAPASPSPLRLAAWAMWHRQINPKVRDETDPAVLLDAYLGASLPDVPTVLAAWAQAVYDEQGILATAPDTVSGAAAVLTRNAEVLARIPDVDTYDAELRWVRRALRDAHALGPARPLGRCMNVDCPGRVWPNPGAEPKCDRCNRRYGTLDLVRLRITEEGQAS